MEPTFRASLGEIMVVLGDGLDEEGLCLSPVMEQRNHVENSTDERTLCNAREVGGEWDKMAASPIL